MLRAVVGFGCLLAGSLLQAQAAYPFLHPNDVVLFQGDSITDGGRWRTGDDQNHIMGQDYAYMIAGRLGTELADRNLTFVNRGIGGNGTPDLLARWQADTLDLRPNVLSILVGVNDTLFPGPKGETLEQYERAYDDILSRTVTTLPGTRIVLGEPFLLPVGNRQANYAAELAQVRQHAAVVRKLGAKYHLPVVPYQEVFDAACRDAPAAHWSWDGVHPTYAGHSLMMQAWLKTTAAFWEKP